VSEDGPDGPDPFKKQDGGVWLGGRAGPEAGKERQRGVSGNEESVVEERIETMRTFVKRAHALFKREEGASAAEYTIIVALIALAIAIGAAFLGGSLGRYFGAVGEFFKRGAGSGW
jgi:Flp pilus assembly pilin Flp